MRPGFHGRQMASDRSAIAGMDPRVVWTRLINEARDLCRRVSGATPPPLGSPAVADVALGLWRTARNVRPETFPTREAAAQALAASFLKAVEAVSVAGEMRREWAGGPLGALTDALDELMNERRTAEAEHDRRRYPD